MRKSTCMEELSDPDLAWFLHAYSTLNLHIHAYLHKLNTLLLLSTAALLPHAAARLGSQASSAMQNLHPKTPYPPA
jgi:hypothetical protein